MLHFQRSLKLDCWTLPVAPGLGSGHFVKAVKVKFPPMDQKDIPKMQSVPKPKLPASREVRDHTPAYSIDMAETLVCMSYGNGRWASRCKLSMLDHEVA